MNHLQGFAIAIVTILLVACGGGGTSDDGVAPRSTTYTGQAFDAAISSGKVSVRSLDGRLLATSTTNADGSFSVAVPGSEPYLIFEVSEGSYYEQATSHRIHLASEFLNAVVDVSSGQRVVNVNILSHLQTGIFLGRLDNVFSGVRSSAFSEAAGAVLRYAQLIPTQTALVDLSVINAISTIDETVKGSLFSAAVSQFVKDRMEADAYFGMQSGSEYTSIAFAQALYLDAIYDGHLDGEGESGQMTLGALSFDSNVYRDKIALAMIAFVRSHRNKSGISVPDVLSYATRLSGLQNGDTLGLFGNQPVNPISTIQPTISNVYPEDDSAIHDTINFTLDAVDYAGIQKIEFKFANDPVQTTSNFNSPIFTVDTTAYADDEYPVVITVTNLNGAVATETLSVIVSNVGTTLSNFDPGQAQTIRGTHRFSADMYDGNGITYRYFYIDNVQQTGLTATATGYRKDIDTTAYSDGIHQFRVYAQNTLGYETEESAAFTVDNTPPQLSGYPIEDGDFLESSVIFSPYIDDPAGVESAILSIDGSVLRTNLHAAPYILDSTTYPEGELTIRLVMTDSVGNSSSLDTTVSIDNQPPLVDIYSPPTGTTSSSQFTVFWQIADEGVTDVANSNPQCGRYADWDGTEYPGCTYLYVGGTIYSGSFLEEYGQYPVNVHNRPAGWNEVKIVVVDNNGTKAEDSISVFFDY